MNKTLLLLVSLFLNHAWAADAIKVTGAGATFPYPLYSKWFDEYKKVDPATEINYQSIGSGGGIRQLLQGTVDFGASDAPMTDEDLKKAQGPVLHIPTVLGAVVLSYNLPGVTGLMLSPEVIADIFLGKITQWNDPAILATNAGLKLPAQAILVACRSDGSGTTAVFTDYLAKVSAEWKSSVGAGPAVKWPVGISGKGNEGVAGLIKQTPGALGYVELVYAEKNALSYAKVKNKAGAFVKPEAKSITAAAQGALKEMPADFRVSITDAGGKESYPISAFTYLLVFETMKGPKGQKFKNFLNWAVKDGQTMASSLLYAPLPASLIKKVQKKIEQIKTE